MASCPVYSPHGARACMFARQGLATVAKQREKTLDSRLVKHYIQM